MSEKVSKRKDYISWDEYFMGLAELSAMRSKDPNTQVGTCIVNEKKRIVGIGYNGFPTGVSDDEISWARKADSELDTKYLYVAHAELNAILNSTTPLDRCTMYSVMFPCNECTKLIIQSGIKEVKYIYNPYIDTNSITASIKMMDMAGVKHTKLVLEKEELIIDFKKKPK